MKYFIRHNSCSQEIQRERFWVKMNISDICEQRERPHFGNEYDTEQSSMRIQTYALIFSSSNQIIEFCKCGAVIY